MKRIIDNLAALTLTFYLLAALIIWLAVGIALARLPQTEPLIEKMNHKLILDWIFDPGNRDWRIMAWFLGLCLLNLVLFVNLLLCSLIHLWSRPLFHYRSKNRLLLVIHILVLLIMLGHLANMGIGYKYSHIKLTEGKSHTLPTGERLRLDVVHYAHPVTYLSMDHHEARRTLTRERFDPGKNYARVQLIRGGRKIAAGTIYRLKPLKADSLRITLNRFFLSRQNPETRVGAIITVAKNPIHEGFFLIYALTIGCLLLYLILQLDYPERGRVVRKVTPGVFVSANHEEKK